MPGWHQETTRTAQAPAKINLSLEVYGQRADGYHELTSLVMGVEWFDELSFTPQVEPGVRLTCDDPALPVDERNLVVRAVAVLAERLAGPPGVAITLRKRIPVAAGLGGGSSDAATALQVLNRLWGLNLPAAELARLGARLGSDVPLFFALPAALITGRGERVQPVRLSWSGWVVLAHGGWAVSTREVYANWREDDRGDRRYNRPAELARCRRASELATGLVNELEPAVFRTVPAVEEYRSALVALTGHPWRISGAGSTAFTLFDQEAEARRVKETIGRHGLAERVAVVKNLSTYDTGNLARRRQHGDFRNPREIGGKP